ncbi:neogenin-like [Eriocheir sinensis]|uniref:neogenin-like n=1 Tax=Eriocheir sinensis TaxID=95602 RepID=UPI0021C6059B|nr:neogenin-like [Eriocheir sinensis]
MVWFTQLVGVAPQSHSRSTALPIHSVHPGGDLTNDLHENRVPDKPVGLKEPNMEFVISLRAFNNVGDGQPVYQQVRTQPEEEEVVAPTLDPAVWVKAVVLTPFTVVLQWADTMLSQNQYNSCTTFSSSSSSRFVNATDVTCLIDSLKPSTV